MPVRWWKRIQYVLEAAIILALVPFALYPSPVTVLALGTLPAAGALLAATVFPRWFVTKPTLRRYAHASAIASSGTAVAVTASIAILSSPSSIHLLPPNYRGPVTVVFACPSAQPAHREGRAQVYNIPDSGVLLVRESFDGKQPRIRQGASGTRELPWSETKPTSVAAFGLRAATWSRANGSGPSAVQYVIGDEVQWVAQKRLLEQSQHDADTLGALQCKHSPSN
jgi:hypothetical protein